MYPSPGVSSKRSTHLFRGLKASALQEVSPSAGSASLQHHFICMCASCAKVVVTTSSSCFGVVLTKSTGVLLGILDLY